MDCRLSGTKQLHEAMMPRESQIYDFHSIKWIWHYCPQDIFLQYFWRSLGPWRSLFIIIVRQGFVHPLRLYIHNWCHINFTNELNKCNSLVAENGQYDSSRNNAIPTKHTTWRQEEIINGYAWQWQVGTNNFSPYALDDQLVQAIR